MPRPMGRPTKKVKNPGKLLMRLMNYIFRDYKFHCIAVFILIFVGVIANVQGTMFTRDLIDKYITPFFIIQWHTELFSTCTCNWKGCCILRDWNYRNLFI